MPESARAKRHQLTAHLTSLGFGNIGSAVWIAPARMLSSAQRAIEELELTGQCAVFVGAYAAGQDLAAMVRNGWDLDGIDRRYQEFIADYAAEADRLARADHVDGRHAFITYLSVVDHWRKLPFRDPGLPPEVLTPAWNGPAAVRLFERLVASSKAARWPTPPPTGTPGPAPPQQPPVPTAGHRALVDEPPPPDPRPADPPDRAARERD
ncbi:PaaX family transcriptional regulator C-terminal domain-containing protein [Streptacidiphilus monticola]